MLYLNLISQVTPKFKLIIMKNFKLFHFLNTLCHILNYNFLLKRLSKNSFKCKKFIQDKGLDFTNSYTEQKNILNYITSRSMSKTLRRSNLTNKNYASIKYKANTLSIKDVVDVVLFSWLQSKKLFSFPAFNKILKFHTETVSLGNLASKHFLGKEAQKETEENWGGPEAFKLITFIKNDFDEILEKHPSVIVFFSAYWCQHCLRLKKPFGTAALMAKEANLPVLFAVFDVNIDPDIADEKGVIGIPTIKFYKSAKFVSTYRGKRTADDLFEFVKNPLPSSPEIKIDV